MENQVPPAESTQSFGSRLLNVYASPSEAFDGIVGAESKGKFWVVPWLVTIVLGSIFAFVMFSNPVLKQQIEDAQTKAFQERVEKGEMTQQQADQAQQGMSQMGGIISIIAVIGIAVVTSLYFFLGALLFWLVGKLVLKSTEGYGTYLALYGTAAWIGVLGAIITSLMIVGMGSLHATPSAGLAVLSHFDVANTVHRLLSKLDVFAIWQAIVLGFGLGKITGKPAGTAIGIVGGLWVVWAVGTALLKFGF